MSTIRSQQIEEAYPDLSNLKKELERAQRERDKSNLDRDGAKLERDQANLKRDQAILERVHAMRDLSMIRAEYQQAQKVRENEGNCEQIKSEIENVQRRQREFPKQKERKMRTTEPAATVPSVRGLDTQPIRPLMKIALPGYTSSSTPSSNQIGTGSLRLKSYMIGCSRGLATIQHEKSDLPPGETIQSVMQ